MHSLDLTLHLEGGIRLVFDLKQQGLKLALKSQTARPKQKPTKTTTNSDEIFG
jgi:hypothetical protein